MVTGNDNPQPAQEEEEEEEPLFMAEDEDEDIFFADEEEEAESGIGEVEPWNILVVDDEKEVHTVSKVALGDLEYEGRPIQLFHAYSGKEGRLMIAEIEDVGLILLDVVMEQDDSGLQMVKYIREELKNGLVRIVLRTGQPGMAPEREVIERYQINDYKAKGELTYEKLYSTVLTALRSYQDLTKLRQLNVELEVEIQERKLAMQIIKNKNDVFEKFVPKRFLDHLGKAEIEEIILGDSSEELMTILFVDIRDFTNLSENMTFEENFRFLNGYLKFIGPAIIKHHGFIDKYIGDSIMALFSGDPVRMVSDALDAAIEMQKVVEVYNGYRKKCNYRPISIGVGIHAGSVSLGTVGFENRMDTTVVGDTVNLASRLEGMTKQYGIRIAISSVALDRLGEDIKRYQLRPVDTVRVMGRQQSVTVFDVLDGDPEDLQVIKMAVMDRYKQGVDYFHNQQWMLAHEVFSEVAEQLPNDRLLQVYQQRCQDLLQRAPSADWDGVHDLSEK